MSSMPAARSRTLTWVIAPSEPHDPTIKRVRSKPATFLTTRPPAWTTAPLPSTKSSPIARSRGAPSDALHGPCVAVANVAPIVPSSPPHGRSGHHCPCARVASSISRRWSWLRAR